MSHSSFVWLRGRKSGILVLLLYALVTVPFLSRYPAPWVDEGWIGEVAAQVSNGQPMGNPSHGTLHRYNDRVYWMPPLYFLLLGTWFAVTGVTLLAGRFFNVLVGAFTVFLIHRFTRRRFGDGPAILAALVFMTDTFVWKAHRTVRFESLLALLATALFVIVVSLREDDPERSSTVRWLGVGVLAGLLANVHPVGLLFALAALLDLVRRKRLQLARGGPWLALLASLLTIVPFALYCLADRSTGFANFSGQNSWHLDLGQGPSWLREWSRYATYFPFPWRLPAALAALALLAAATSRIRNDVVPSALVFIVVPAVGLVFLPNKTLLYLVTLVPFLAVLAGALWNGGPRPARYAVLLLIVAGLVVNLGLVRRNWSCRPLEAYEWIRGHLRPDDRVAGTFVTWWAVYPRPFLEFSRADTIELVDRFAPDVIVLGDRQWAEETKTRFAGLADDLDRRFAANGVPKETIEDTCLGRLTLHVLRRPGESPR
jgi:4-amino-4-deoxy-L-arabinose transferase-like glycosyltransferase